MAINNTWEHICIIFLFKVINEEYNHEWFILKCVTAKCYSLETVVLCELSRPAISNLECYSKRTEALVAMWRHLVLEVELC